MEKSVDKMKNLVEDLCQILERDIKEVQVPLKDKNNYEEALKKSKKVNDILKKINLQLLTRLTTFKDENIKYKLKIEELEKENKNKNKKEIEKRLSKTVCNNINKSSISLNTDIFHNIISKDKLKNLEIREKYLNEIIENTKTNNITTDKLISIADLLGTIIFENIENIEQDSNYLKEEDIYKYQSNSKYYFLIQLGNLIKKKGIKLKTVKYYKNHKILNIITNFIVNDFISLHKYTVSFNITDVDDFLYDNVKQINYINNTIDLLKNSLNLGNTKIIITNFYASPNLKYDIIFYDEKETITEKLINDRELIKVLNTQQWKVLTCIKKPMMESLILSLEIFDEYLDLRYNYVYKKTSNKQLNKVGGYNYIIPNDVNSIGIQINKYGNDTWINGKIDTEQWPVAYHPISGNNVIQKILSIFKGNINNGVNNYFQIEAKKANVYLTPDFNKALDNASSGDFANYYIIFMCRINPLKIKFDKKSSFWTLSDSDIEYRPYKLLFKYHK